MAVQVPDTNTRIDNVIGSLRQVTAKFASVTSGDTWTSGLASITNAQATSGGTAALVTSALTSGVLTFGSTSTNVQVSVLGY